MRILDTSQFVSERMKIKPVTNAELDQIQQDMNSDKYELTGETIERNNGKILHRIKALKDIPSINVKKGDLGGFVESYDNLDQKGDCWIGDEAMVWNNAKVYGDAYVFGYAYVFNDAQVYGNAKVYGGAMIWTHAQVYGNAKVYGNARVYGNAEVNYDVKDKNIDK